MGNKGTLIVDLDGTICPIKTKDEKYEDLVPYLEVVDKLREWRESGFRIVVFTARNMKTHQGNLGLINVHTARIILNWLDKWEVPYDEVLYGKPWPGESGFYIDDRAIRPDEFVRYSLNELEDIVESGRSKLSRGGTYA
ncbi:capsular biosynthesis protein [Cohnella lubricantis]|uniref:Capsular biosynthesis protein n=1 Tax=Cohnella lubricantis TaxID=2163172 RepID=A0A841TBW6_9BACL|nr:capsular biosynthesis protein [Cohnella lubricantis]MBB6678784.1 capsular biosynthesis protein [Cohnella lubricantis]MBP2117867.1 capsule biosynthesis phosphatase [Cohnella lubricantis]